MWHHFAWALRAFHAEQSAPLHARIAELEGEKAKLKAAPAVDAVDDGWAESIAAEMVKKNPSYPDRVSLFHPLHRCNAADFKHNTDTTISDARNAVTAAIRLGQQHPENETIEKVKKHLHERGHRFCVDTIEGLKSEGK